MVEESSLQVANTNDEERLSDDWTEDWTDDDYCSVISSDCSGEYQLVFCSPEILFMRKKWRCMLTSPVYSTRLRALVIDVTSLSLPSAIGENGGADTPTRVASLSTQMMDSSSDHTSVMGTSSDHMSQVGSSSDHMSLMGSSSDYTSVMGTSSDHMSLMGASSDHTSVMDSSSDHTSVMGSSSDHTSVIGSSSDHKSVMGKQ